MRKYREQIKYLFYGVQTTIVNFGVFGICIYLWGDRSAAWANIPAFIAATAHAYLTNKLFVFESREWKSAVIIREVSSFVGARLFSFGFEELGLFLCIYLIHVQDYIVYGISGTMIAKIVLSFMAVVMNYTVSKYLIFGKSGKEETAQEKKED